MIYFLICSLLLNAILISIGVYWFVKTKRNKQFKAIASRATGTIDENGKITLDKIFSYDIVKDSSSRSAKKHKGPGILFKEEDNTGENNSKKI